MITILGLVETLPDLVEKIDLRTETHLKKESTLQLVPNVVDAVKFLLDHEKANQYIAVIVLTKMIRTNQDHLLIQKAN